MGPPSLILFSLDGEDQRRYRGIVSRHSHRCRCCDRLRRGIFCIPSESPIHDPSGDGAAPDYGVLGSCWAIVAGCILLWRGHVRSMALIAALLCLSWSLLYIAGPAFLVGLAARLRSCSSSAEIEAAARSCLSLMPQGGYAYGPDRMTQGASSEEAKEIQHVWDSISNHPFVHLGYGCAVVVRPPSVSFEWGSALTGHWGIQFVSTPNTSPHAYFIRFSDNILLFQDA